MIVITRLNVGGIALHVSLLASRLDPSRYRATLVFGKEAPGEASMRDVAEAVQADVVYLPSLNRAVAPLDDWRAFFRLWKLFRRERPSVVHTHTAKAGALGRLAARLAGVPVVVHSFHGHVFHGYFDSFWSKLIVCVERALGRLTDCIVIAGGSALRDDIVRYRIVPTDKIVLIPYGIDLQPYLNAHSERGRFRASLGISSTTRLIGIVGRLVSVKNHRMFLAAAQKVCAAFPQACFVVVGDGELRPELEGEAVRLGLANRVIFTGWRRDLPAVYADLDLLALTSFNEGTGLVLVEAMAAGCPVVATRVGGVPDVVRDGITGRLVDTEDADGLASVIAKMLADSQQTRAMVEAARTDVARRYTIEALVRHTESLYERLLAQKAVC